VEIKCSDTNHILEPLMGGRLISPKPSILLVGAIPLLAMQLLPIGVDIFCKVTKPH